MDKHQATSLWFQVIYNKEACKSCDSKLSFISCMMITNQLSLGSRQNLPALYSSPVHCQIQPSLCQSTLLATKCSSSPKSFPTLFPVVKQAEHTSRNDTTCTNTQVITRTNLNISLNQKDIHKSVCACAMHNDFLLCQAMFNLILSCNQTQ